MISFPHAFWCEQEWLTSGKRDSWGNSLPKGRWAHITPRPESTKSRIFLRAGFGRGQRVGRVAIFRHEPPWYCFPKSCSALPVMEEEFREWQLINHGCSKVWNKLPISGFINYLFRAVWFREPVLNGATHCWEIHSIPQNHFFVVF